MRKLHYIATVLLLMFLSTTNIKAQQLSQDPLYKLVFADEFDSTALRKNKWNTNWDWSPANMYNTNKIKSCNGWGFPGPDTVDIAYTRRAPYDTANRKFYNVSNITYQRIISKKENFSDTIVEYYSCPSSTCIANGAGCYDGYCAVGIPKPFKYSTAMIKPKFRIRKYLIN